jgi:hypothetical protein
MRDFAAKASAALEARFAATLERARQELDDDLELRRMAGERSIDQRAQAATESLAAELERAERSLATTREGSEATISSTAEAAVDSVSGRLSKQLADQASAAAAEAEGAITAYADKTLSRKARRQELKLAREERESRIVAAERRIAKRGDEVVAQLTSTVERLRDEDLAELRTEVEHLSRQAHENVDGLRTLVVESEQAVAKQAEAVASEIAALEQELDGIDDAVRASAAAAVERVAETARIAEATVSTEAHNAAAVAIRDVTETASQLTRRIEQQANTAEARDRLDDVLERLRAADERLRESDERTRLALTYLRVVS